MNFGIGTPAPDLLAVGNDRMGNDSPPFHWEVRGRVGSLEYDLPHLPLGGGGWVTKSYGVGYPTVSIRGGQSWGSFYFAGLRDGAGVWHTAWVADVQGDVITLGST